MVFGLILLATLSAGGAGTVAREVTLTRHVPDVVARGVAPRIGAPLPQQTMEISISLPSRNEAELQALLSTIYDPASPYYRHYLTVAEFTARYGPAEADYRSILRFALAHNLRAHALVANRRVLDLQGTVADVERAFAIRIGLYSRRNGGRSTRPTASRRSIAARAYCTFQASTTTCSPSRISCAERSRTLSGRWRRVRGRRGTSSEATSAPRTMAARRSTAAANRSGSSSTPATTSPM